MNNSEKYIRIDMDVIVQKIDIKESIGGYLFAKCEVCGTNQIVRYFQTEGREFRTLRAGKVVEIHPFDLPERPDKVSPFIRQYQQSARLDCGHHMYVRVNPHMDTLPVVEDVDGCELPDPFVEMEEKNNEETL